MRIGAVFIAITFLFAGTSASALDVAYEATLGAGHSDNITRSAVDEQDQDIAAVGLSFAIDHVSPRIEGEAVGDLAYHDYLDDAFESDVLGNVAADVSVALVPEKLRWVIADSFGQALNDPFTPANPENRENINYFSTGPSLMLALGSQNRLLLDGRYSIGSYEESPLDSEAVSAQFGLMRVLSAASSISVNVRTEHLEFDEALLHVDYDQNDAFMRYDVSGARTYLTLDLGYSEIDRDVAAQDDEDGLLLRLDVSRRLSGSSIAFLYAGREFSNSGAAFATSQSFGSVGLQSTPGLQTAAPFVHDYASIGWSFDRNRTSIGLRASWSEQSYEDQPALDQAFASAGVQFRRQLSTRTSFSVDTSYLEGEFEQGGDYDELYGAATMSWRLSRSLSLNLSFDHYRRDSDLSSSEITENRYWLSIGYGEGTRRRDFVPVEFAIDEAR